MQPLLRGLAFALTLALAIFGGVQHDHARILNGITSRIGPATAPSGPWTRLFNGFQAGSSATSTTISGITGITGANLFVVGVAGLNSSYPVSVSDGVNTYSSTHAATSSASGAVCQMFYVLNPTTAGVTSLTVTGGAGLFAAVTFQAWKSSGGSGAGALDQAAASASVNQASPYPVSTGSAAVNNEMFFTTWGRGNNPSGGGDVTGVSIGTRDNTTPYISGTSIGQDYFELQQTTAAVFSGSLTYSGNASLCVQIASFEPHS